MKMSKTGINFLLVTLILIETLSYTYLLQTNLYYSISILYFLSGLGICLLPLFMNPQPGLGNTGRKSGLLIAAVFAAILTGLLLFILPEHFRQIPVNYHIADMLPRIKIYATRFLNGQYVYDDVKEIWNGNLPPYFPATWAPFIPSVLLGFDMRWVPVASILLAVCGILAMIKWGSEKLNNFALLVLLTGLFLLFNFHLTHRFDFWTMTYEGMIAAYYLMLCIAIISWNPYLMGVAISLCLLSRFSFVFWVPPFLVFLWWRESLRFAAKTSATIMALVSGLFIIPFVIGHVDVFLKTLDQYRVGAAEFWKYNNIDSKQYNEVGLYKFFVSNQLLLFRKIQLCSTIAAPVIFLFLSGKYFPSGKTKKVIIGLCSLKFTLLFFYNFIEMPFHYLFITPTIISYAIGLYYLSLNEDSRQLT